MKKFILLSIVLLSLLISPLSEAFAQARLINYQGNILNEKDEPYQGPVQITFELYTAEFGGSQLWSEIQNPTLNKGYFNVYLGSESPFPANFNFNRELWLQVTVGKGSPYQRTRLSMVPYSGYSDRSAVAGFAEDIPDGSVTLAKLADEVKKAGGDLEGFYPNPKIKASAILENIPDGSITQDKLSPNVTTRPSGPASGDLTGFYPDPLIAAGAVKTDRLADQAVTNEKLADHTIKYAKLQNAAGLAGTILAWNGTAWIETSVPTLEEGRVKEVLGFDGNYATTTTDGNGFLHTSIGIAVDGVTTSKIANQAVTYSKLQNAAGAAGTILAWNGTAWAETTVPALEADGVIGNEVLNATPNRGLVRAGAGTAASPYTLGIADDGIQTSMIQNQAVTLSKLANGTTNSQVMYWNALTNSWKLSGGPAPTDNQVLRFVNNGSGVTEPVWSNDDAIVGNEITDVIAGGGLQRQGAGTTASPYLVGIAPEGIVNSMIKWHTIEYSRIQKATGPAGTIISWNGTDWIENNVPALEKGKVFAVTAGAGTTVNNTADTEGFITAKVGIADGGVTNNMIANGAVSLSKLAPGTQIGQIMWWDQAANQWRFSTGAAPTQDYVVKWVDNGGTLTPQWAPDDMTIPFEKTITEQVKTLFALTNNGNSDVMSLTTTGKGDGLLVNVPNDLVGGGHAAHFVGGGLNQPSLLVDRVSEYGLPHGAATINATVNTLDANTAGFEVKTTINDDGNNSYEVDGARSILTVNNGVNDVYYTGLWGDVTANTGYATGVWGTASGTNNQINVAVAGEATNGAANIGVLGSAESDSDLFLNNLSGTSTSIGVAAYNTKGGYNDYGMLSNVEGNATGISSNAEEGAALIAANESTTEPSIFAYNAADGTAFIAASEHTDNYSAAVYNFGNGRGMLVMGGTENTTPLLLDPTDVDNAALVVTNPLHGTVPYATAIKTYGDIWANSSIGASQIIGLDSLVIGNPITGPYSTIFPPAFVGAPLVINSDVLVNGDIEVDDANLNGNLDVALNGHIHGNLTVDGTFTAGATTLTSLTVFPGATSLQALTAGATTLNSLGVTTNATIGGTLNVTGLTTLSTANINTANITTLNVSGLSTLGNTQINGTLGVTGHSTLNSLGVTNNATVGGTFGVTGATTLGNTLTVAGATNLNNTLTVAGATTLNGATQVNNNLVVTGTSNLQGAATLGNTLTVAGATTLNGATQVNNNLVVTGTSNLQGAATLGNTLTVAGATTLNNTLAVAGNANFNGANVTTGATTKLNLGYELFTNGSAGIANNAFLVSRGPGLSPTWTNQINQLTVNGLLTANDLNVINDAVIGNDLTVNGLSEFNGDVTINATLEADDLIVYNTTTLTGTVDVLDELNVYAKSYFHDDTEITGNFKVTGNTNLVGPLTVSGVSNLNNDVNIAGNNNVAGNLKVVGTTDLQGAISNSVGVLNIVDDAQITGNLVVTGGPGQGLITAKDLLIQQSATINQNLTVNQNATFNQNATVNQNFTVGGHTSVKTFDVAGDIKNPTLGDPVWINDDLDVNGDVDIHGNLAVLGTITVTDLNVLHNLNVGNDVVLNSDAGLQNTTLDNLIALGSAIVTGNTTLGGDLDVTGATTLQSTLDVTGATTLNGATQINNTLGVTGATTLAGLTAGATTLNSLGVTNNTTIGGTLGVTGATTLAGLTAGATTLNSLGVTNNTTIGGTLDVTGATTLTTLSAASGAFSGAVTAATVSTTGNITAGGVFVGPLQNNISAVAGSGLTPFTFDNTGNATVAIANNGVTSAMILDGTIVDADVNAAAAIAGTKINPNFGAQNVLTTGSITGNAISSNTTVTATGNIVSTGGLLDIQGAGLNNISGNLNIGGTSTFNGPAGFMQAAGFVKEVKMDAQLSFTPVTTNGLDWSTATLGQRASFIIYDGVAGGTITNNPESDLAGGGILIVHNGGAANIVLNFYAAHTIVPGQTVMFVNLDGNPAHWVKIN